MTSQKIDRRAFLAGCAAMTAVTGSRLPALAQSAGPIPASVQLDQVPSGGRVLAEFTGLSFDAALVPGGTYLNGSNGALAGYVRALGRGVLHVGGPSVDTTTYTLGDLNALAAFANAINWRVILGLSLTTQSFSVGQQAALALQALGDRLIGFELGGAPDSSFKTYEDFLAAFREQHRSIVANAPGSNFAGPGTESHDEWIGRFAADARAGLVLLTSHYVHTGSDTNRIGALARTIGGSSTALDVPYRITRVTSTGAQSLGGALWALDFAFRMAQNGADGVNFFDAADAQQHPSYQAMQLLAESEDGAFIPAHVQTTHRDLSVYAVQRRNASRVVTILNRSESDDASVTIASGGAAVVSRARRLTGLSLGSSQAALSGWMGVQGGVIQVPAGSAVVART